MDNRLTSARIKEIRSLQQKKFRAETSLFVVEGEKMVQEALSSGFEVDSVWRREEIGEVNMSRISSLSSPSPILAVLKQKNYSPEDIDLKKGGLYLLLDGVKDPGNMGTIIRTADAAGFDGVLLSPECADLFSPKVLRSTMGSIFRLGFSFPKSLPDALTQLKKDGFSVLSSQLDGDPFYERKNIGSSFVLVIGNEGNGITDEVKAVATHRLCLPMRGGAESLNAAVAAGIMMYDLTR